MTAIGMISTPQFTQPAMQAAELVIWSTMMGGLITLIVFILMDALTRRRAASWQTLVFATLTGVECILLTGLVDALVPTPQPVLLPMLKNSLGLLSGALTLRYLGHWMVAATADKPIRWIVRWGPRGMALAAAVMALLTAFSPPEAWPLLLIYSAALTAATLTLPAVASARSIVLGDQLAWGMLGATALLAVVIFGLHAHATGLMDLGVWGWSLTAIATVAYLTTGAYMALRRDRAQHRLQKLALYAHDSDPSTGLPSGPALMMKVEDAFWRSARKNQDCAVVCIRLLNLYELAQLTGHHGDMQILSAMAARIRRAIGFRHVTGLYHASCFAVVISATDDVLTQRAVMRLRHQMSKPLKVRCADSEILSFQPKVGIGLVRVTEENSDPLKAIVQAERLSMADEHAEPAVAEHAATDFVLP